MKKRKISIQNRNVQTILLLNYLLENYLDTNRKIHVIYKYILACKPVYVCGKKKLAS
jgi:hypothetical protein